MLQLKKENPKTCIGSQIDEDDFQSLISASLHHSSPASDNLKNKYTD